MGSVTTGGAADGGAGGAAADARGWTFAAASREQATVGLLVGGGGPDASRRSGEPGARGGGVAVGGGDAPPDALAGGSSGAGGGEGPGGAPRNEGTRHKRTLSALALGLCAVGLAVGSGADFTARTANPSNVFSAGALSMENSKDGSAILSATGMKPGAAPRTGIVDIKNTGSIDGRFTVSRDQLTNTDPGGDNPIQFAAKVVVAIVDCGQFTTANTPYGSEPVTPTCGDQDDHTVYLGPLSIQNGDFELGTYAPGEKHRYEFEASLDNSAGNEYSGDSSSARYVFDAKQTP